MADSTPKLEEGTKPQSPPKPKRLTKAQQLNKLYALPAPLRTFPLPTFVPHNPISLFQILYAWVSQTLDPSSSHLDPLYQALFSPHTRSVHVTDVRSIRGLWEQGFYGKGTLSRSEPAWLEGEKRRHGSSGKTTSEEVTRKRRAERQQTKWERARKEREAIDQKLLEEAEAAVRQNSRIDAEFLGKSIIALVDKASNGYVAPVGPLELLALPNSDMQNPNNIHDEVIVCRDEEFEQSPTARFYASPVGPFELLALPNSVNSYEPKPYLAEDPPMDHSHTNGHGLHQLNGSIMNGHAKVDDEIIGGSDTNEETADDSTTSEKSTKTNGSSIANGRPTTPTMKRQKSVRFSPTVEKNTFIQTEPPSPERSSIFQVIDPQPEQEVDEIYEEPVVIKEQEHLQVTLEEAFFLSYALGALTVSDPQTKKPIPTQELFYLFRRSSYFPPQATPSLSPDDPFMINYVVYHHFRSLGWVVRSGIKFSCDYMLYLRGPVFSHAEFGVIILPSYSDPYWKSDAFLENYTKGKESRTWAWMSCINRVIGQVKKTLILCYVDIPKPLDVAEEQKMGVDGILARYKVREIILKRFSTNRMRD